MGVVSYRICTEELETEECFESNTLISTQDPEDPNAISWFPIHPSYDPARPDSFLSTDRVFIPANLTCEKGCTLSWRWDCRDQTEIWSNCADVIILPQRIIDEPTDNSADKSSVWTSPTVITIFGVLCSLVLTAGFIVKKKVTFARAPIILNPDVDDPHSPDMESGLTARLIGGGRKGSAFPEEKHNGSGDSLCYGFPMSIMDICGPKSSGDDSDVKNSCDVYVRSGILHKSDNTTWANSSLGSRHSRDLSDLDESIAERLSEHSQDAMSHAINESHRNSMVESKSGVDLVSGMVDSFRERFDSDSSDSMFSASGSVLGDDPLSFGDDQTDTIVIKIHNEASGPLLPIAEDSHLYNSSSSIGSACPKSPGQSKLCSRNPCMGPRPIMSNPCMGPPAGLSNCQVSRKQVARQESVASMQQDMGFEWLSASYVIEFSALRINKRIGFGGGGQVYQGRYCESEVAVKLLNSSHEDFGWYKEAERELRFLSTLHCPQIVQFIGVCINVGDIYFVTELCEKGSMQSYIETSKSAIAQDFCLQLLSDISKGMSYLHNQSPAVIHRDLKPGNILLDSSFRGKICDFGLTRIRDSKRRMTSRVGTGYYCAPEVFMGEDDHSPYTEKMDVYSFAMVMYTLFEREEPFYDTKSKKDGILRIYQRICDGIRPARPADCPQPLGEIMERCWHKNPQDRPSFPQVLEMLRAVRL
jgi:hypothetical protein